jgi:hypothetical protein
MKESGKLIERRNDRIGHIRHCNDVVLDDLWMDAIAVKAQVALNSGSE